MRPCCCGKPVRLGAYHVSVNRKRGVAHYIVHADDTEVCEAGEWPCVMLKPYPKNERDKPWVAMVERWESGADVAAPGAGE